MLNSSMEPTKRQRNGKPMGPRRLRLEPLELRTLLSASPFAPPGMDPGTVLSGWMAFSAEQDAGADYTSSQREGQPLAGQDSNVAPVAADPSTGLSGADMAALQHSDAMREAITSALAAYSSKLASVPVSEAQSAASGYDPTAQSLASSMAASLDSATGSFGADLADALGTDPGPGPMFTAFSTDPNGTVNPLEGHLRDLLTGGGSAGVPEMDAGQGDVDAYAPRPWTYSWMDDPGADAREPQPSRQADELRDAVRSAADAYMEQYDSQNLLLSALGGTDLGAFGPYQAPAYDSLIGDSGLDSVATYKLFGLMDTWAGYSVWTLTSQSTQSASQESLSYSTETLLDNDLTTSSDLSTGVTSSTGLEEWSEGGLIDISEGSSSFSDDDSEALPSWLRTSVSEPVERGVVDLLWGRYRDRTSEQSETEEDSSEQKEQRSDQDSRGEEGKDAPAKISDVVFESSEGGMIELSMVSYPSVPSPTVKTAHDRAERVSIDRGLAFYQAFELATSPLHSHESAEATEASHENVDSSADPALTTSAAEAATSDTASQTVAANQHHAAAAPVIMIVSMASSLGKTSGDEDQAEDEGRQDERRC